MKKTVVGLVAMIVVAAASAEKPKFDVYGFVKGDLYYASAGVKTFGLPSLVAINQATGSDSSALSFSAQHSRIGVKGSGKAGAVTMGGQAELDFYTGAANSSGKARIRLAYAWVKPVPELELRFGQQWDIFSPLNPTTINTGANLWFDGNYGGRRAQIQARYSKDLGIIKPQFQFSAGEATSENDLKVVQAADTSKKVTTGEPLGPDNLSKRPLFQGRFGLGIIGTAEIGFSAAYAAYNTNADFKTRAFAIDANFPFSKCFELKFEWGGGMNMGTNAGNACFLSVGGNKAKAADPDVKVRGFWLNAITRPWKHFNAVAGVGRENVVSEESIVAGGIKRNQEVYGDLIFPIGEFFTLTVEYEYLSTMYKGASAAKTANVIEVAGQVNF